MKYVIVTTFLLVGSLSAEVPLEPVTEVRPIVIIPHQAKWGMYDRYPRSGIPMVAENPLIIVSDGRKMIVYAVTQSKGTYPIAVKDLDEDFKREATRPPAPKLPESALNGDRGWYGRIRGTGIELE